MIQEMLLRIGRNMLTMFVESMSKQDLTMAQSKMRFGLQQETKQPKRE